MTRKHELRQPVRKSARLQDKRDQQQQSAFEGRNIKPKSQAPSTLPSNAPSEEILPVGENTPSQKQQQRAVSHDKPGEVEQSNPQQLNSVEAVSRELRPPQKAGSPTTQRRQADPYRQRSRSSSQSFVADGKEAEGSIQTRRRTDRKRKQLQETEEPVPRAEDESTAKRPRLLSICVAAGKEAGTGIGGNKAQPVIHWVRQGNWPKEYFETPSMAPLGKKRAFSSIEEEKETMGLEVSLGGEATQAAMQSGYEQQLMVGGIIPRPSMDISEDDELLCESLLYADQSIPQGSLFQDNLFKHTIQRYYMRSEALVFRDITPLVCPSAELLCLKGSAHLAHLREEINSLWTKAICLISGPRPKPDYMVGLSRSAFTAEELKKLAPWIGFVRETSFVQVTRDVLFPFLFCEAKSGNVGTDVADLQNAHCASIAVNAVFQLYKNLSREKEVEKKILAFSISHNSEYVVLYGHLAKITENSLTFHQHYMTSFSIRNERGKDKWKAYKFTRNVYDKFLPIHLERIKSAIKQFPEPKAMSALSLTSNASTEKAPRASEAQEMATSAPPSSVPPPLKRFKLLPKASLQKQGDIYDEPEDENEITPLKQQEQQPQQQEQITKPRYLPAEQQPQSQEPMEHHGEQREQQRMQIELLSEQMEAQKEQLKELMELMRQQRPGGG